MFARNDRLCKGVMVGGRDDAESGHLSDLGTEGCEGAGELPGLFTGACDDDSLACQREATAPIQLRGEIHHLSDDDDGGRGDARLLYGICEGAESGVQDALACSGCPLHNGSRSVFGHTGLDELVKGIAQTSHPHEHHFRSGTGSELPNLRQDICIVGRAVSGENGELGTELPVSDGNAGISGSRQG